MTPCDLEQSNAGLELPAECSFFGACRSRGDVFDWLRTFQKKQSRFSFLLVLAGSRTAEIDGISAAGSTPSSRKYTAVADAELLLYGPGKGRRFSLPPLDAGVSPALISHVSSKHLGLSPVVLAVGLAHSPEFPHIRLESPSLGPAECLSKGHAMDLARVNSLWRRGFEMGMRLHRPLILAECVPGGTTTAQAVLTAFGLSVGDLIGSSAKRPPFILKKQVVDQGIRSAGLSEKASPQLILSALGDPFQPVAAGLLLGARQVGQKVLLGGGSQMLSVLALALASLRQDVRYEFAKGVAIGTTAWLLNETPLIRRGANSIELLTNYVGEHFGVDLFGFNTGLRFHASKHQALRDYELGYVKEGVGMGALSFLAQLQGMTIKQLAQSCDNAMDELLL